MLLKDITIDIITRFLGSVNMTEPDEANIALAAKVDDPPQQINANAPEFHDDTSVAKDYAIKRVEEPKPPPDIVEQQAAKPASSFGSSTGVVGKFVTTEKRISLSPFTSTSNR